MTTIFSAIEQALDAGDQSELNDALINIQNALGQIDGGAADLFFSGDRALYFFLRMTRTKKLKVLKDYVGSEINIHFEE